MPVRNEEITLHPAKQKGMVLRFEGNLPTAEFLKRHFDEAARIDLPLEACCDERFKPFREKISAIIPRSIFLSETKQIELQIEAARKCAIKHATISNLYHTELCNGFYLHGDYAFNVVNRECLNFLENYSLSSVMLSPETDGKFVKSSKCALEYIGYGRTPLMYTRTCIIKNIEPCHNKSKCFSQLVDRTGAKFPIISSHNHTNLIYNSLPAFRLDKKTELKKCGVGLITLFFTTETEKEMENVISLFKTKEKPNFEYTRR